jgi:2-polyprenyl-6-methoxyphenol hydroxylase-like FAD-dependent oxidoreductase
MAACDYDLITVGGGLAGAALAKAMTEKGARILVLERETAFRDRVRGELIEPWGVAELKALGIYDTILERCGKTLPFVDLGMGPRPLLETTPQKLPFVSFPHAGMQEAVLNAAASAGAEVRRGVQVRGVEPGKPPAVRVANGAGEQTLRARLVVGADGRDSQVRRWVGFEVREQRNPSLFAGVLLEGVAAPEDTAFLVFNPECGSVCALLSQPGGRFRAYVGHPADSEMRLQGEKSFADFVSASGRFVPPFGSFYARAKQAGPLASFPSDESWVERPYRQGVALIGDAAATTDPMFGQGLSLACRDVRVLRDCLTSRDDWNAAGDAYADARSRYFGTCHRVVNWFRHIFVEQSEAALQDRRRALPLIGQDPRRVPDHLISGPELPADESVRARFFGEV